MGKKKLTGYEKQFKNYTSVGSDGFDHIVTVPSTVEEAEKVTAMLAGGPVVKPEQKNRDYQRSLHLDFSVIAEAQKFYAEAGYTPIAVPWVIDEAYIAETKPDGVAFYSTLGGVLVASAEQSFIQMMDQGWDSPGSYQATTPCFRDEEHDETHSPYFMKTELFDNKTVTVHRLEEMIATALKFFNHYLPARVENMGDGTFDIVGVESGVELGSYGIRERKSFRWVYGTGVALPRFTYVQEQELSLQIK